MNNAIYTPCVANATPSVCLGISAALCFTGFIQQVMAINAVGGTLNGIQSAGTSCYRIYYAPRTDPLDLFEELYAKKKRFLPYSICEAIEIKFSAFRKSTMGEIEILDFLKIALNLPIKSEVPNPQYNEINKYLENYKSANMDILNAVVHHTSNYSVKIGPNSNFKNILFLEGAPGVGKTKMVEEIARMMNIPLITVDLGSADQSHIFGTGSESGLLLKSLIKTPVRNAVLFLDEMDRVVNGTATPILTSLLPFFEPNTNYIYNSYLRSDIDISHYFIIGAGNSIPIDVALQNRINVVRIEGVTSLMKHKILRKKIDNLLYSEVENLNLKYEMLTNKEKELLEVIIKTDGPDPGFRFNEKKLSQCIDQIRLERVKCLSSDYYSDSGM